MSDYIKREDAEQIMYSYGIGGTMFVDDLLKPSKSEEARQKEVWEMVRNVLDRVAIKDVEPVRHGHWIKISPADIYECSECGKNVMTSDIEAYEYCHGCGARMEEDTK